MNNYKNLRLVKVYTTEDSLRGYTLTEVTYDDDGEIIDMKAHPKVGESLKEVRENLESLLADLDNWEEEELELTLV